LTISTLAQNNGTCDVGNGFGGEATRQEPEEVPVTALDWILGRAVPSAEFICAQIRFEMD
jgi:hypothetical protein